MKIFVDDERHPEHWSDYDDSWTVVRNFEQFQDVVYKCSSTDIDIEIISFDHDLGKDMPTGYDYAKWLTEQYIVIPEVWAHTMNTPGKINILTLMKNWQKFNNLPVNVKWIQLKLKNDSSR